MLRSVIVRIISNTYTYSNDILATITFCIEHDIGKCTNIDDVYGTNSHTNIVHKRLNCKMILCWKQCQRARVTIIDYFTNDFILTRNIDSVTDNYSDAVKYHDQQSF